ncbi:MAG: chromosomal replication initiator protein DnaA [Defluviitaleaceae bacterium]|nr:chromosomal replication initiator protein DnaA [Defluviitaleaceae bacterium]
MDKQAKEIWESALAIARNEFTDVTYKTIISPFIPRYIKDNILYVESPEPFFKETVEKRYMGVINSAIKSVSGQDIYLQILNSGDTTQPTVNKIQTNLVPKYTFEGFVKAKSNELACATATAVAQNPGTTAYNPLFLYGGVGLGKTHLMHSIGNYIMEHDPTAKVLYCSTETFVNELITSIQQNRNEQFRDKYRATDVLLMDDIQFLEDKDRTQEEFFHTFNILRDSNRQIVISSDKPPRELKTLEDRLTSRFGQGIIVDLKLPDIETRIAILEKKAQSDNVPIPKDVILFIADNFYSNIRDLEGALNRVIAYSRLEKMAPVDFSLAKEALKELLSKKDKKVVDADYIQTVVSAYYNITIEEMRGKAKTKNIAIPRQIAMYMCRKLLPINFKEIGHSFGGRDHSTVIHSCNKITDLIKIKEDLKESLLEIERQIVG